MEPPAPRDREIEKRLLQLSLDAVAATAIVLLLSVERPTHNA